MFMEVEEEAVRANLIRFIADLPLRLVSLSLERSSGSDW